MGENGERDSMEKDGMMSQGDTIMQRTWAKQQLNMSVEIGVLLNPSSEQRLAIVQLTTPGTAGLSSFGSNHILKGVLRSVSVFICVVKHCLSKNVLYSQHPIGLYYNKILIQSNIFLIILYFSLATLQCKNNAAIYFLSPPVTPAPFHV